LENSLSENTRIRNHILSRLTPEEERRLGPHLKFIDTELGEMLLNAGDPIDNLFFPEGAMGSVVGVTAQGGSAEIGLIGWEGVIGAEIFLGADRMANRVNIQMPDGGYVLPADVALREFERGGPFQAGVLRFFYRFLTQISQTAVCNALHGLEQRLSRWLLMCLDRSPDDKIRLTQEFLSLMVGASRQSVSMVASMLQDAGVITYSRGVIRVVHRDGLERFACDCYAVMRRAQEL
jgi:CRP-like cAMP-binding protein